MALSHDSTRFSAWSLRVLSCSMISCNFFGSMYDGFASRVSRMSAYCGCCKMSNRDVSSSRKGVMEGGGGAVPALMTELGVVFLLRDRRLSRLECLPFFAPGRGGILLCYCGVDGSFVVAFGCWVMWRQFGGWVSLYSTLFILDGACR